MKSYNDMQTPLQNIPYKIMKNIKI